MLHHSMDFFNKMQSGFLMSRITNDTRSMQAALSSISSDLFKQPVTIISGVAVLLYMDWKFTIVTLVLFPSCIVPICLLWKTGAQSRAGRAMKTWAQMVVTMQETFAGIRVIKSFAREKHQEKLFRRSNRRCSSTTSMRIIRATEAVGPLVETIAAIGVGLALLYVYFANLSAARFFALNVGIFLLYDPIKNAEPHPHRHAALDPGDDGRFSRSSIPTPTVQDAPTRSTCGNRDGLIEFDHVDLSLRQRRDRRRDTT